MKKKDIISLLVMFAIPALLLNAAGGKQAGGAGVTVTLSTVRTMDSTILFEQSDPERRSFDENRWNNAYLNELGIKLVHKWIAPDNDSANVRWNTAVASGDLPDFAVVNDNQYKLLLDAGYIAEMGDVFAKTASKELLDLMQPDYYRQMTINGKLYGMPLPTKAGGLSVLYIRKDWLDKLGLPFPVTLEDLVSTAKAFMNGKLGGNETLGMIFMNPNKVAYGNWEGIFNPYGAYMDIWLEKNGQLAYSTIQPEARDALLAMQTLYREGIMNRDFAVTTEALVREYIASGKVGIIYGAGYISVTSFGPLYAADPNADFVCITPPSLKGRPNHILQSGAFQAKKVFVNNKCKNPEGVVQLANLSLKLYREKPQEYFRGIVNGTSFPWFKYITFGDTIVPGTYDFDVGNAIRQAEKGDMSYMQDAAMLEYYDRFKQGKTDRSMKIWIDAYGIYPDRPGSRTVEYDVYHSNRALWTAFGGLPTETMSLKMNIINSELEAAMTEVVMGANISVFDQAVRKWRSEGGDQITKEVNDWYKGSK